MKKTSRIAAVSLAVLALLGLSGCAEVTVNASVIDNDSAVFVMDQRVSPEGMKALPALIASGDFTLTKAVEPPPSDPANLTTEELCAYASNAFTETTSAVEGTETSQSCDENGFSLVTRFPVTYSSVGVTAVGSHEINAEERRNLPFRFYVDYVYKDVVFEHDIIGLKNQNLLKDSAQWAKVFSKYDVSISFPGDVTDSSNDGVRQTPQSVTWNYDLVKAAVDSRDYTISAAGRADYKVDPIPILVTIGGVLFLLLLLVYFMWKRFSPKVIIAVSYILALLGPFGVALAMMASHKARNNADGAAKAAVAVWATSAIFVFEILVLVLMMILAPDILTEILANLGIANSSA